MTIARSLCNFSINPFDCHHTISSANISNEWNLSRNYFKNCRHTKTIFKMNSFKFESQWNDLENCDISNRWQNVIAMNDIQHEWYIREHDTNIHIVPLYDTLFNTNFSPYTNASIFQQYKTSINFYAFFTW